MIHGTIHGTCSYIGRRSTKLKLSIRQGLHSFLPTGIRRAALLGDSVQAETIDSGPCSCGSTEHEGEKEKR